MQCAWDEAKRIANLPDHGIDFVDAERVFAGLNFTYEDDRLPYGERRFVTLGLPAGIPVSMAHIEEDDHIHLFSFRKATRHETALLFSQIKAEPPAAPKTRGQRHSPDSRAPRGRPKAHRKGHRPTRPKGRRTQDAGVTPHRRRCPELVQGQRERLSDSDQRGASGI